MFENIVLREWTSEEQQNINRLGNDTKFGNEREKGNGIGNDWNSNWMDWIEGVKFWFQNEGIEFQKEKEIWKGVWNSSRGTPNRVILKKEGM